MLDAGWSRPAEQILLGDGDLFAQPWPDVEALQRVIDSGYLAERGVEVWRQGGYERSILFRFPAQVPCVTTLPGQ